MPDRRVRRIRPRAWTAWLWALGTAVLAQPADPEGQWVAQRAMTAGHRFELRVVPAAGADTPRFAVDALRVFDRGGGAPLQEVRDIGGMDLAIAPDRLLSVLDINGDGYPDLAVAYDDGGAGPNRTDAFFLWDPAVRAYRHHARLSELTQVRLRPGGLIESTSRGGCCQHQRETYRFFGDELRLVSRWERGLSADGRWVETTTGTLRGGRWVTRSERRPARD